MPSEITDEIKKAYASEDLDLKFPEKIGFRHFRFKLEDKTWRKVPHKITNQEDFMRWVVALKGVDLYYGITSWLNPHKVSSKMNTTGYACANNVIIDNDLIFDIDAPEPITETVLDRARQSAWNLYYAMKDEKEYEFQYCAFTGYKGFRLVYKDKGLQLPEDYRLRIEFIENRRKLFIEALLKKVSGQQKKDNQYYKLKTFFDKKITVNPMAVIRLIGSYHSTTGYQSIIIPVMSLKDSIRHILSTIPHIGKERPGIPKNREMTQEEDAKTSTRPRLLQLEKDVTGLTSSLPSLNVKYFFTNRVLGIKRGFIPILIYQDTQKNYRNEILKLQEKYKLGRLYVYHDSKNIIIISLKTMQKRQLIKLLNESTSSTKHNFRKYNRIFAPFFMKQIEVIPSKKFTSHYSLGHFYYVEPQGKPEAKIYCGWDKIEIVRGSKNG